MLLLIHSSKLSDTFSQYPTQYDSAVFNTFISYHFSCELSLLASLFASRNFRLANATPSSRVRVLPTSLEAKRRRFDIFIGGMCRTIRWVSSIGLRVIIFVFDGGVVVFFSFFFFRGVSLGEMSRAGYISSTRMDAFSGIARDDTRILSDTNQGLGIG